MQKEFSWIQTHIELSNYIQTKRNDQISLINLLKEVGIEPFNDQSKPGETDCELEEIDPFTFYCYIYKYGTFKRLNLLYQIAQKLKLPIPEGESGIPKAQAQKVWLFPYKYQRSTQDIPVLWDLFDRVLSNSLNNEIFEKALNINSVGKAKLTEALFYVDPINFLPINKQIKDFLNSLSINSNFNNFDEYQQILNEVRSKTSKQFYQISNEATANPLLKNDVGYWVFQCNPQFFKIEEALQNNAITDWNITNHKDKIKVGDKIILWVTGENAGCYALGEVTGFPSKIHNSTDNEYWQINEKDQIKAPIKITHNFVNNPIKKEQILSNPKLKNLKYGIQGTNFTATKTEFEALFKMAQSSNPTQYWLYSPGERAKYWNEFYEKGIMALGWDELGDLNQYQSNDEVNNRFKEIEADDKSRMNFAKANFEFLSKAKIGDYVLVKSGRQELVGYGVISSDYYFDESRETYKSCRKVDWKEKGNWNVDHDMVVKTFTEVGKYKTEDLNYAKYGERLLAIMKDNILEKTTQLPTITHPLNTIFYGPPGTGKTYHTILRAAEIISNKTIQNYDEAKRIFQEHLGNRIEFITFHQNYSYEDFIQGLRPIQNSNGPLAFEMKDGIFKKIAHRAEENYLSSQWKEINKRPFEDTFQDFFEELLKGEVEEIEIPMKKASYYITNIGSKSLEFRKASGGTAHTLSINTLRQMYISESTMDIQGLSAYYAPLLDQLLKKGKSKGNSTTGKELQSYVIVIDEINRANISRVFGELITLIEPDKRLGAANELSIKLPNDEVFCIPKNLYLIGTMNTADKSIALLDIALRRRFDFEPMYPIYETNGAPIPFASHLEKMNQEIIRSKGYDFQIGHAYFMGENENLVSIINQKVIPLLMEYFMNDGGEVKRILQKSGFVVDEKSWPLKISGTI